MLQRHHEQVTLFKPTVYRSSNTLLPFNNTVHRELTGVQIQNANDISHLARATIAFRIYRLRKNALNHPFIISGGINTKFSTWVSTWHLQLHQVASQQKLHQTNPGECLVIRLTYLSRSGLQFAFHHANASPLVWGSTN
jgi:hypothetical protein